MRQTKAEYTHLTDAAARRQSMNLRNANTANSSRPKRTTPCASSNILLARSCGVVWRRAHDRVDPSSAPSRPVQGRAAHTGRWRVEGWEKPNGASARGAPGINITSRAAWHRLVRGDPDLCRDPSFASGARPTAEVPGALASKGTWDSLRLGMGNKPGELTPSDRHCTALRPPRRARPRAH